MTESSTMLVNLMLTDEELIEANETGCDVRRVYEVFDRHDHCYTHEVAHRAAMKVLDGVVPMLRWMLSEHETLVHDAENQGCLMQDVYTLVTEYERLKKEAKWL